MATMKYFRLDSQVWKTEKSAIHQVFKTKNLLFFNFVRLYSHTDKLSYFYSALSYNFDLTLAHGKILDMIGMEIVK